MSEKYQVIATASHWAIVDFGLSVSKAKKHLRPVSQNGSKTHLCWLWGFKRKADAELFVSRCNSKLAFKSGIIGRWIIPSFTVSNNTY